MRPAETSFNEAVGYYRRNPAGGRHARRAARGASMRPSDITDGIERRASEAQDSQGQHASMRPSDITDGILRRHTLGVAAIDAASMRPSDITDGIRVPGKVCYGRELGASMRPSDITDGITGARTRVATTSPSFNEAVGYYRRNPRRCTRRATASTGRFNEAVGYYRRNLLDAEPPRPCPVASMRPSDITDGILQRRDAPGQQPRVASMRPSDITDGISPRSISYSTYVTRFNEAVGYYRRNRARFEGTYQVAL